MLIASDSLTAKFGMQIPPGRDVEETSYLSNFRTKDAE